MNCGRVFGVKVRPIEDDLRLGFGALRHSIPSDNFSVDPAVGVLSSQISLREVVAPERVFGPRSRWQESGVRRIWATTAALLTPWSEVISTTRASGGRLGNRARVTAIATRVIGPDAAVLAAEGKKLPLQSIVVVELKRPMRDDATGWKNPIEQWLEYVGRVRGGALKTATGRQIPASDDPPAFCNIIADLTPTMVAKCKLSRLRGRGVCRETCERP